MKRQFVSIIILITVIGTFFSSTQPVAGQVICHSASGTARNARPLLSPSYAVNAGDVIIASMPLQGDNVRILIYFDGQVVRHVTGVSPQSLSYSAPSAGTAYVQFLGVVPSTSTSPLRWSVTVRCNPLGLNFNDGRCNQEPWQAFAVYPDNKGGYIFYAIYHGVGYYAMHVTEQNLDDNPDTGTNHIIAQDQGIQLWRLAGGGLQASRVGLDDKLYNFVITCGMMED